jgi:hypothetical protein
MEVVKTSKYNEADKKVLRDNFKPVIFSKAKKQTFSKIKKIENFDLKDENFYFLITT